MPSRHLTLNGLLHSYPGSPLLARTLLRTADKLLVNELHPEDAKTLHACLGHSTGVRVTAMDAYQFLKANLPPPEKRGIVLIDPAYEAPDERRRLIAGTAEALNRFATGVFLIWYPIKDIKPAERLQRDIAALNAQHGLKPSLDIRLMLRSPRNSETLAGCGVFVLNPPHTLKSEMLQITQHLAPLFSGAPGHGTAVFEVATGNR